MTSCGAHGFTAMPSVSRAGARDVCWAFLAPAAVTRTAAITATAAVSATSLLATFVAACSGSSRWVNQAES